MVYRVQWYIQNYNPLSHSTLKGKLDYCILQILESVENIKVFGTITLVNTPFLKDGANMRWAALLWTVGCRANTIVATDKPVEDEVVLEDADGDGYFGDEDCDDQNAQVHAGVEEICDGIDNNCNGEIDEGVLTIFYIDEDGDGFGNPDVSDEFCSRPEGYVPSASDCDDADPNAFVGNNETCDGIDNNCNGEIDEGVGDVYFADQDGDGFGNADNTAVMCELEEGFTTVQGDCDDTNADVYPEAEELCDGIDNNCDGVSDDANLQIWYQDADGDGFGLEESAVETCLELPGYVTQGGDCDDGEATVSPAETEICDGIDNNCDGITDDDAVNRITWYQDGDGDGFGDTSVVLESCTQPNGYVGQNGDCDDALSQVSPTGIEVCDGLDNDCDGLTDDQDTGLQNPPTWYLDADGDGFGVDTVTMQACTAAPSFIGQGGDCNDLDALISPDGIEVCDLADNNCDGQIDEGVELTFYYDGDGDGYGIVSNSTEACIAPNSYVDNADDCNDAVPEAYTNAAEVCDGIDNDCNGQADEGVLLDWYLDLDGDGFGSSGFVLQACTAPSSDYVMTGGDCDENNTSFYPGAPEGCADLDQNCDGTVDNDADLDGYSAYSCGGSDCDDADASIFPNAQGVCPLGTDCLDILQQGYTTSGVYTIDPDGHNTGLDAEDVWCEQQAYGGGWTRYGTNDPNTSLWNTTNIRDAIGFGTLNGEDYKSELASSGVLFTDLMFTDEILYAVYENVSDGSMMYYEWSASIPRYNCAPQSGYEWPMTQGNLGGGQLCTTSLYMHPIDRDGYSNCNPNAQWAGNATGPTWSLYNNGGCPLDDPSGSTYILGTPNGGLPWSDTGALYMYIR